jgi:hypothetical protein
MDTRKRLNHEALGGKVVYKFSKFNQPLEVKIDARQQR